jgi:hypothetical protein
LSSFRVLYVITLAGFLSKVRRYRFVVILVLCIVGGYIFVPAPDANYVTFGWHSSTTFYRGVYNSAWIGALVTLLASIFLSLFGFYVVNYAVKRDEETRVGQIIATTPIRNWVYMLGNTLSNFVVLSTMVVIVFLTALGMQFVRGEVYVVDLWTLFSPFLVLVIPLMFLVAAIAVLFERIPLLRRRMGNVIYVFVWLIGLPLASERIDLFGLQMIKSSIAAAGSAKYPDMIQNAFILGFNTGFLQERTLAAFTWRGIQWTFEVLQTRLLLICLAFAIPLFASYGFNRFDPSSESQKAPAGLPSDVYGVEEVYTAPVAPPREAEIRPLDGKAHRFGFGSMLLAECRLVLREFPSIGGLGFLGAGALIVAGGLLPLSIARGVFLPIAWILPLLYWSKLGTRESRYGTDQLVFSSAYVVRRQLLAMWLAGVLVSLATGSGVAVNLVLHGDLSGVVSWGVGALFIPSMALCLGVWTGSCKLFEFLYALLWYVGPMSGVEFLDFMGALPGSVEAGVWWFYLAATVFFLGLTYVGRSLQIKGD